MKIEKNDMVMVYDGGGTVPHCKYTGMGAVPTKTDLGKR